MTNNKTILKRLCTECYGIGEYSNCCNSELNNNRCLQCGRFAKKLPCYTCFGSGYEEFKEGDKISFFIAPKLRYGSIKKIIRNSKIKIKTKKKIFEVTIEMIDHV